MNKLRDKLKADLRVLLLVTAVLASAVLWKWHTRVRPPAPPAPAQPAVLREDFNTGMAAEVERMRKAMELARKTHANERAAWKAERAEWAALLRAKCGASAKGTPIPWEHRVAEVETEKPKEKR